MAESFDRLLVKCKRTNKHLDELKALIREFTAANPYKFRRDYDPDSGKGTIYCHVHESDTLEIAVVIEDILHGMRSTLDHLAYHLVAFKNSNARTDHLYFPIAESFDKYRRLLKGQIESAGERAIGLFNSVEPYGGGKGKGLWHMNTANNTAKHKLLLALTADITAHSITNAQIAKIVAALPRGYPRSGHSLLGRMVTPDPVTIFTKPSGTELTVPLFKGENHLDVTVELVFGEPQVLLGKAVVRTLTDMNDAVLKIVKTFIGEGLL